MCPRVAPTARRSPISARALHHADEHDVRDAEGAHNERQSTQQEEHDIEVRLDFVAHPLGFLRNLDLQGPRLIGPQCSAHLLGDQVGRTDLRLHDDGAGATRPK